MFSSRVYKSLKKIGILDITFLARSFLLLLLGCIGIIAMRESWRGRGKWKVEKESERRDEKQNPKPAREA